MEGIAFFFFMFDEEADTTVPVQLNEQDIDPQELEFYMDDTIRKVWDSQNEEWYFSIIDVVGILTDSETPKRYWSDLKKRLSAEGNETYAKIVRLKLNASDGKMRLTDCANSEQLLRIIQSIPSKKAEPFKLWLARVGKERLDEMADPEKALDRGMSYYQEKGYTDEWIKQRLQSKAIRDELTDEWKRVGISDSKDYATLTNILTAAWSGKTIQAYKKYKGLHKENLRDNMTNIELTLNQLAEVSTTARLELESKLGHSVISPRNASDPASLEEKS